MIGSGVNKNPNRWSCSVTFRFAPRVSQVKPSATLAMAAQAAELRAAGKDVISLSVGEPDFGTPPHVRQAAIEAIEAGQTRYTPVDGTPELKQAVIDKRSEERRVGKESRTRRWRGQ